MFRGTDFGAKASKPFSPLFGRVLAGKEPKAPKAPQRLAGTSEGYEKRWTGKESHVSCITVKQSLDKSAHWNRLMTFELPPQAPVLLPPPPPLPPNLPRSVFPADVVDQGAPDYRGARVGQGGWLQVYPPD